MARKRADATPPPRPGGIAGELMAAGFLDAVEIGRGGGGVVYRCYQTTLGRSVAVKVLGSDFDEHSRERFLREGYAMGALSGHPNIESILQVGVTESGRPYIVMPYHGAGSLAQRLRRVGRIPWPDALRLGVKLCGALETAHRSGTLHRDIKPANVLLNDYGEPQLSDFGIARIPGGYKTQTGVFSGTIAYTAPEVLAGSAPTASADVYSLGATIYALIAGAPAHEAKEGEDIIAHYLRIGSAPLPDLRADGIPGDVCAAIEKAMSHDLAERYASAEDFGREMQLAQRHLGLVPDSMALNVIHDEPDYTADMPAQPLTGQSAHVATSDNTPSSRFAPNSPVGPSGPQGPPRFSGPSGPPGPPSHPSFPSMPWPPAETTGLIGARPKEKKWNTRAMVFVGAAAALAVALVIALVYFVSLKKSDEQTASPSRPVAETQADWRPITNARIAREAGATTEADGTIWIFGGVGDDDRVSGRHEGYDPAIDSWKGGDDLPEPVQHAMAVTWQDTPVVLGGWRTEGSNSKVATDKVWRIVNSRWVELPPLLQPRAAAAAAVVGDRIIVTGGVDAGGKVLATTEIFDGKTWTLAAAMPTPRQMLGAASDGTLVYVVGGNNGSSDLAAVEMYDPAVNKWSPLPGLSQARSDFGLAVADGRLVAVGGMSGGNVLKSVESFDLAAQSWAGLPDLGTARHGVAVSAVGKTVYAIGGATGAGNNQVTSSAEALKLAPRKTQPSSQWRTLPDAPTARLMMAWAVFDGKIWIAGGMRRGETLQTVQSYDPATGAWQSEPPLPIPLHHATATTYRGEMVVLGGASDEIADATNKVFALRGDKWVELPSLRYARAAAAAAVVGDKLVVVGGQNGKQLVAQTEIFDGDSWTEGPDLPTPREHLAAVSDGVYVYAVGGRFLSADKNTAAFERFDPETGKWDKLVEMPTPRGSYGAAFIDGRIVAVGGEEPTRVLATVEMYDISDGKWSTLTPMNTPRHGQVVAAVGSTVYVIGGANRPTHEGPVATVEALDFT